MSGRIVYEPTGEHHCDVMFRPGDNGLGTVSFDHPAYWAKPGTVLECDCASTFVAQEHRAACGEMFPRWRREGRIARWRRERRSLKDRLTGTDLVLGSDPGIYLCPEVSADPDVLPPSAAIAPPRNPEVCVMQRWVVQWDDTQETVIVLGPGFPAPMVEIRNGASQDIRPADQEAE